MRSTGNPTQRRLGLTSRWSLLATSLAVILALWWPSMDGWSALLLATLINGVIWLCWRSTGDCRTVPGNLAHLALAAPLVTIGLQMLRFTVDPQDGAGGGPRIQMAGEIENSLALHAVALMVLMMMMQDTIPGRRAWETASGVIGLLAAGMACAALTMTVEAPGREALGMMGWTGVALLLTPTWRLSLSPTVGRAGRVGRKQLDLRLAAGGLFAVALALLVPRAVPIALLAAAAVGLLAAAIGPARRGWYALASAGAGVVGLAQLRATGSLDGPLHALTRAGLMGIGGQALGAADPESQCLSFALLAVGLGAAIPAVLALAIGLAWPMWRARPLGTGRQARVLLLALPAAMATASMLAPRGAFIPAINVLFALTWAALAAMTSGGERRWTGWLTLGPVAVACTAVGLTRRSGLGQWVMIVADQGDGMLHALAGWLTTHLLLWLLGRRRWGWAWVMGLSLGLAGGGELLQKLTPDRAAQWSDFLFHVLGAATALGLWAICRAAGASPAGHARPMRR